MKIKSINLKNFKRFTELKISNIPQEAKLVIIKGSSGSGKSSVLEALDIYKYVLTENAYPAKSMYQSNNTINPYIPTFLINYYVNRKYVNIYENKSVDDIIREGMDWAKSIIDECIDISFYDNNTISDFNLHIRYPIRSYSILFHDDLYSTDAAEKIELQLTEYPSKNNVDNVFALNIWAMFNYKFLEKIQNTLAMQIANRRLAPVVPINLEVFAKHVDSYKEKIHNDTVNYISSLINSNISKTIIKELLLTENCNMQDIMSLKSHNTTFLNMSTSEFSVYDLILDFVVRKYVYPCNIICIDKIENNIPYNSQGKLLKTMYNISDENNQLWITTNSNIILNEAQTIMKENNKSVCFIDMDNLNNYT